MRTKCDYCGHYIEDTDPYCGNCGAPNDHLMRSAEGVPKTIEELQNFCAVHRLPLEKMRFFIGIDYKEPKAFGIYKDENGNFVVYKNKADGTRAIRYRGSDEAYAVNEIYQKMKSEIQIRKNGGKIPPVSRQKHKSAPIIIVLVAALLPTMIGLIFSLFDGNSNRPNRGYYNYDDTYYYYQNREWYYYDDDDDRWHDLGMVDDELSDNYKDYFEGSTYDSDYGTGDFKDTDYYYEAQEQDWDDDWDDDDWDWDGGDWDTGATDWDTDWIKLFDIYDN